MNLGDMIAALDATHDVILDYLHSAEDYHQQVDDAIAAVDAAANYLFDLRYKGALLMTIADEAYQQGLNDYKRGVRHEDNPHPPNKRTARREWSRGFTAGAVTDFAAKVVAEREKREALKD
jgi:hypothetical protein